MDINDEENIEWLMESSKTVENSGENEEFEIRDKERSELRLFLQILRAAFENEPVILNLKAKGIIKNDDELQKLQKRLKALGYFFSIRSSDKKSVKSNRKLMIANKKSQSSIHPYRVVSHIHYYCSHRSKKRQVKTSQGKHLRKHSHCKATMDIRQVEIFTHISLTHVRRKRIEALKEFRQSLETDSTLPGDIKYSVVISLPKVHNHSPDVRGQYLSEEVKAVMHSILQSGVTSLPAIQEKLFQIVDQDFFNDYVKPSRDNSAFYPNLKTIYNHLRHDGIDLQIYRRKKKVPSRKEMTNLRRKVLDEFKFLFNEVQNCVDHNQLLKIHNALKSLKK